MIFGRTLNLGYGSATPLIKGVAVTKRKYRWNDGRRRRDGRRPQGDTRAASTRRANVQRSAQDESSCQDDSSCQDVSADLTVRSAFPKCAQPNVQLIVNSFTKPKIIKSVISTYQDESTC